jgi:outer membrane autotransporter protein
MTLPVAPLSLLFNLLNGKTMTPHSKSLPPAGSPLVRLTLISALVGSLFVPMAVHADPATTAPAGATTSDLSGTGNPFGSGNTSVYAPMTGGNVLVSSGGVITVDAANNAASGYDVMGGGNFGTGSATGNTANVRTGATVEGFVVGGLSGMGSATGNWVYMSGGTVSAGSGGAGGLIGGEVGSIGSGAVTGNTVSVSGGAIKTDVIGGRNNGSGEASGNEIFIEGGTITGAVRAGVAANGNVSGNAITLTGGTVEGIIAAGTGNVSSSAVTDNSITIENRGTLNLIEASLYGHTDALSHSGNTLRVKTMGVQVQSIQNFDTLRFEATGVRSGEAILKAQFADVAGSTVNAAFSLAARPTAAPIVLLETAAAGNLSGTIANPGARFSSLYGATQFDFELDQDTQQLFAKLTGKSVSQQAAGAYVYGASARSAALNNASDHIMTVIDNWHLRKGAVAKEGFAVFASVQGSTIKTKVGSSVDNDGVSFILGGAWEAPTSAGNLTVGIFAEGGIGNYDAYSSFGNGDGDTWHYGVGAFGKFHFNGGAYLDGSVRVGRVKADYDGRNNLGYDSETNYYGAHLGAGYEYALSQRSTLDGYAKVLWTTQESDTVSTKASERLAFDNVDSIRTRLGGRYIHTLENGFKAWGGLAWEHEFDGEVRARLDGQRINHRSESEGDTGIAEAGIEYNSKRWRLSGGVQGMLGKREGVAGTVTANYKF